MRRILIGDDGSERGADPRALGRVLAELADPPAEVVTRTVADDDPAEALHRLARELPADAIVVGASHRGAAGRVVAGSVTERTLHGAPCAVAVAPRGYAEGAHAPQRIGVAYNGSPAAQNALAVAHALVQGRDDATVVVVDVADLTQPFAVPYGYPNYAVDLQAIADDQLQQASGGLEGVAHVELVRRDGDPVHELIDLSSGLDLLVIGSRGHGPLRRLLLGSVSTHLVRGAACPLLLLPLPASAGAASATPAATAP